MCPLLSLPIFTTLVKVIIVYDLGDLSDLPAFSLPSLSPLSNLFIRPEIEKQMFHDANLMLLPYFKHFKGFPFLSG